MKQIAVFLAVFALAQLLMYGFVAAVAWNLNWILGLEYMPVGERLMVIIFWIIFSIPGFNVAFNAAESA